MFLPVSGEGVLAHVDSRGLLHRVDEKIANCGVCVCVCMCVCAHPHMCGVVYNLSPLMSCTNTLIRTPLQTQN